MLSECIEILRNRYDKAMHEMINVSQQRDLEKFQWYRGYMCGLSQAIYMLEVWGVNAYENERHTHEEV